MSGSNTTGNPLSSSSLTGLMASSLPKTSQLRTQWDAIALAVHAGMIAVGFRLVGLGEEDKIEAKSEANKPQPLPEEWNKNKDAQAFRYAHSQSSMEYVIKVSRLGGKAVIFGIAMGDDKTASFDIAVNDYVSQSSLPSSPAGADTGAEQASRNIQDIFISPARLNDFGQLLKIAIIQKLAPGLQKEGYEETKTTTAENRAEGSRQQHNQPDRRRQDDRLPGYRPQDPEPARPHPFNDPLAVRPDPNRPLPEPIPGFENEYEINRPPRGFYGDGRNPLGGGIGGDDLYPPGLGPHDPIRPHLGGGLPGMGRGGGGMHPTFDDPLFGGQGGHGDQGGYDPLAPPGARYDPVGPGDMPRDRGTGSRFPGGGGGGGGYGGMGGRPPNPFGGFGGGDFI